MLDKLKEISKVFAKTCFVGFLVFYLVFHLVNSENGLLNYVKQKNKAEEVDKELTIIKAKRDKLSNKVNRLYTHSLDVDLLDEQYRRSTGKIKDNEVIYYY